MNLYFKAGSALNQHQLMCPTSTTKKKILSKVGVKLYACFVCCSFFNVDYIFLQVLSWTKHRTSTVVELQQICGGSNEQALPNISKLKTK